MRSDSFGKQLPAPSEVEHNQAARGHTNPLTTADADAMDAMLTNRTTGLGRAWPGATISTPLNGRK